MTVLVTGATGNVGAEVVRELARRGVPARAFVRDPAKGRALLGDGADLAVGDFADAESFRRALRGADRLFLACGNVPGQVEYETGAIEAAKAAGVRRIVKLSAAGAAVDSPLLFPSWQGRIEEHLRASGVPAVVLRPSTLMPYVVASPDAVAQTGRLLAPAAGARVAWIHPGDVAAVAAVALTEPAHDGATYVITGPEAITYDQIAGHLSDATGRAIEFVDVSDEAAWHAMLDQGVPTLVADFLVQLFGALRKGLAAETTGTVRALTGREPRGFAEFAREHAHRFGAADPAGAASAVRAGSTPGSGPPSAVNGDGA